MFASRIEASSLSLARFHYFRGSNCCCSLSTSATATTAVTTASLAPSRRVLPSVINRCDFHFGTTDKHTVSRFSSTSGSDSITYSGGQASVGQGGFYGSGGARALSPDHTSTNNTNNISDQQNKERNKMLAMAQDVQTVRLTMQELELLESLLRNEEDGNTNHSDGISSKSMEIKNSMKKLMTSTDFLDSLNNLEVQGEPAWGLSCEEREMIILAREKVNAC